ncbi:MAG: DUF2325 domain-containing protein [Smithellaceae bacterium]
MMKNIEGHPAVNPTGRWTDPVNRSSAPLRFWEIDKCFHCPIAGLCLTEAEQIDALKKAGIPFKNKSAFEIHERLVASSGSENALSLRINQTLNAKYGSAQSRLHARDEDAFMRHWRESFQNGDYLDVFWAAVTRQNLSQKAQVEIFGMIHMSMHATSGEHCRNRQRLTYLENEMASFERKYKDAKNERRKAQKENEDMVRRLSSAEQRLQAFVRQAETARATQKSEQVKPDPDCETPRRDQIDQKDRQLGELEMKLRDACRTIERLQSELEMFKHQNAQWEAASQNALQTLRDQNSCTPECPAFNLCQKRILIVGGIARMEANYRRLIEERGGILEYHEGHMKNGTRQLESSLKRADIILCPVNCNSHGACSLIKNLGKKHNKPVHMMSNFSLSAVSQALTSSSN